MVGCGKIADQHVAAVKRIPFSEMVGVCDRELLMAEQLAERFKVPQYSDDLASLLKDSRPDVVHITTPPQSHFALASQCLNAGCHVYVEKPFTIDTDDAERLIALATNRGLKLTAGHNAQFTWESLRARQLVRQGFLGGPPTHIESYYTYNLGNAAYAQALLGDKNHWVRRLPGKLLQNVISHGIARVAEYLDSDGLRVAAFGYSSPLLEQIGASDVVDELRVHVADGSSTTATFVFSSQISPPVNGVRLYGPRNSLYVDGVHHNVIRSRRRSYKSYINYFVPPVQTAREYVAAATTNVARFLRRDFHDDSGVKNLVEAFYRSIVEDAPPPITYDEILRVSTIMDAIFEQVAASRQTALSASNPPVPAL